MAHMLLLILPYTICLQDLTLQQPLNPNLFSLNTRKQRMNNIISHVILIFDRVSPIRYRNLDAFSHSSILKH